MSNASTGRTVAFFPEAAFGPALNSVGIAQTVQAAREVFALLG